MLKILQYCYSALLFLRPHYSTMLSFFINFFLSLFRACLLPKSLLSPLLLLPCHTISPKLLPLPLTISANSFTTTIFFFLFLSSFSLSLVLSVPLSFCCLSLRQALHSSPKHVAAVILQTHMLSPRHHHRRYLHPHCSIRIRFLHHPITLHSLRFLHTHMPLPILCSLSTPFLFTVSLVLSIHSFLLFLSFSLRLSVSLSLCISSSWVLGVAEMRCWVWLGCGGFLWIMGLNGGSCWVSAVVQWMGFAIWYRWVLISVVLIDFGGFLISVAGFMGWSGWLWVLGVG